MLLDAVILVLREVLEAAALISLLVCLSRNLHLGLRWLAPALPLGMLGAYLFAVSIVVITDALDGAGQELVNAALQLLIYILIVAVVTVSLRFESTQASIRMLHIFMALSVSLAMIREGSEIWIYVSGFAAVTEYRTTIYAGSAIGAGIGLSVGVLLFAVLRVLPSRQSFITCLVALCLIGAGMVMQATMLLMQVDWLPAGMPLWDSSGLLSEQSVAGELLYAVFGYEATPSAMQVCLYLGSLMLSVVPYLASRRGRAAES